MGDRRNIYERHATVSRILVVEDDSSVRLWVDATLSEAGYAVTPANTVAEARSLLAVGRYDIIVADWKLPDGSGALLAREAKASGVAALVITGYGPSLPPDAFDEYGCLWKPFDAQDLLRAVKQQIALGSAAPLQTTPPV